MASTNDTHTSAACCDAPISRSASKYSARGTLHSIADTSCYISGSSDASKAIFFIYDVFGFQDPTWQGADILAAAGYLVIMPDFFDGEAAKVEWMDLPDEEKKAKLGSWMGKIADAKPHIARIHRILDAAKARYPSVQGWGAIGFCWGGKMVSLTSGSDTPWKAGVQSSPARVDAGDAAKTTIPMMMLASKDEPAGDIEAFRDALTVSKHVETFDSQIHGWMSARADLEDAVVRKEYQRGYDLALEWFAEHIR